MKRFGFMQSILFNTKILYEECKILINIAEKEMQNREIVYYYKNINNTTKLVQKKILTKNEEVSGMIELKGNSPL